LVDLSDEQLDAPPSSRAPLPEGTLPVGVGLLISGVASYAFLKVITSALGKHDVEPVTGLWFATFALAPGFFLPLEQELGRALAHRRARNEGGRPVVHRVRALGLGLCALVILAILIISPLLVSRIFAGNWVILAALLVAFACYAPTHIARGIASGSGRFNAYAIVMGADGAVRIVLCLVLYASGVKNVGAYGMAVALSPLPGVLWVYSKGDLRTDDGPAATWQEVTPNLGWLLLGSVCAAGLVNAGPLAAKVLAGKNEAELVHDFSIGVVLSRVPLFLFQAVQAALLPRLSRLAARNEIAEFRSGFKRLMVVVLGVSVVGTAGAFALGPVILDKIFGTTLSRRTLAMLALGSALYMIALALAQAVIALKGHALVALGWGLGMITFVVATWLSSSELFPRVEIGLVASSVAALVAFAVALRSRLRSGHLPSGQSVIEAITDLPLES
jgi:O-antigen/teichoic acid export membrane protein